MPVAVYGGLKIITTEPASQAHYIPCSRLFKIITKTFQSNLGSIALQHLVRYVLQRLIGKVQTLIYSVKAKFQFLFVDGNRRSQEKVVPPRVDINAFFF